MLHCLLNYWCLLLLCFVMLTHGHYLTTASSQRGPQLRNIMNSMAKNRKASAVEKRNDKIYTQAFQHSMLRHKNFHEQAFVEKMFRLFDINSDQVIERDEFKAIFKLLGLISHSRA